MQPGDYLAGAMSDEELDFEDALTDQDDEEDDLRKNLLADLEPTPVKQKVTSHQPDKEHMQIFLRVRPFSTQEIITGENQVCKEQNLFYSDDIFLVFPGFLFFPGPKIKFF